MPSYHLSILGQEVSFKTNVGEERIKEAARHIENRFQHLDLYGSRLSKEKLLILVALSLADDSLQNSSKLQQTEDKLARLLDKISTHADSTS
jgi:cell division protein ZapA